MSRKGGHKDSMLYDTVNNVAMADQPLKADQLKEKIAKVREVFNFKTEEEVELVLHYYDYDENAAIDAYMKDGAEEALKSWNNAGNNNYRPKNLSKNKKKTKKKNKKESNPNIEKNDRTTVSNDADDNSNVQNNNSQQEGEKDNCHVQENCVDDKVFQKETEEYFDVKEKQKEENTKEIPLYESDINNSEKIDRRKPTLGTQKPKVMPVTETPPPTPTLPEQSSKEEQHSEKKLQPINDIGSNSLITSQPRQRTGSSQSRYTNRSRNPSSSEDHNNQTVSTSQTSSTSNVQVKRGLEKSLKDLSRQTSALQRIHNNLEEEIDKSYKRIKNAFQEVQKMLEERQAQIEQEMDQVKIDARELLVHRKELGAELKHRAAAAKNMSESEWNELRADIKQFVVERKYDEELGKTVFFKWDKDRITQEISSFGEVNRVKNHYSQRRQSASSAASSVVPEPSQPSQSVGEESVTSNEKNDSQGTAEPGEVHHFLQNDNYHGRNHHTTEGTRIRVFANSSLYSGGGGSGYQGNRYPNNRNRGGWRGRGSYVRFRDSHWSSRGGDRYEESNNASSTRNTDKRENMGNAHDRVQNMTLQQQQQRSPQQRWRQRLSNSIPGSSRSGPNDSAFSKAESTSENKANGDWDSKSESTSKKVPEVNGCW